MRWDRDSDALTDIWTRYAPAVRGYLAARGVAEPDDVTSEVFIAVFGGLSRFKGDEAELRAFIFTVAHHRVVDEHRRRARRPGMVAFTREGDRRTVASAEDAALARLGNKDARILIEALPPDQRDVLLLRVFGDLTLEQTSRVLGKRLEAVKAAQHRALARLRKILEQAVSL
jgi:RNA polymerase sigma factor (sigma-70 family)